MVSEADFIAAQAAAPPAGRAGGTSLAAGRAAPLREVRTRLETAWSNRRPAYRCRHGRTSATGPGPGQAKNTYVREDQILPHLAALAILAADDAMAHDSGTVQLTGPAQTADLIDQLRASGTVLTDDPDTRTIRFDGHDTVAVTTAQNH